MLYCNTGQYVIKSPQNAILSKINHISCTTRANRLKELQKRPGILRYAVYRDYCILNDRFLTFLLKTYSIYNCCAGSIWMWTLIIDNIAQMWALYCLVIFYQALKHELAGIEPLPKFLCVKAVVFFSFWQGLFLDCLVFLSIIKDRWVFKDDLGF